MAKAQRLILVAATIIVGLRLLTLQTPTPRDGLHVSREDLHGALSSPSPPKSLSLATPAALGPYLRTGAAAVMGGCQYPHNGFSGQYACSTAVRGVEGDGIGGRSWQSIVAPSNQSKQRIEVSVSTPLPVDPNPGGRQSWRKRGRSNIVFSHHAQNRDRSRSEHAHKLIDQLPRHVLPQLKSPRSGASPQNSPAKHASSGRRQRIGPQVAPDAGHMEPEPAVLEVIQAEREVEMDSARDFEMEEPLSDSSREKQVAQVEGLDDQTAAEEEVGSTLVADKSYPHPDPQLWLAQRLAWLHLLKKPGVTVQPVVLAAENVDKSRHTKYTIWSTMQVKNMALDDFFKYLPMHDYGASSTPQHKTCALVGNSGILLDSKMGQAIDRHEAVMRINYPPTRGFEDDVGSKTSYDFSNRENARRLLNARHIPKRPTPSTIIYFEVSSPVNRRTLFGPLMDKYPEQPVHFLHPDFVFRSIRLWAELQLELEARMKKKFKKKPMSGWLAMMFMIQMCEKLDVYGFEAYNNPHAAHRYHYFDKVKAVLQHHSFDFAVEAYKLLGKVHSVTLH